MGLILKISQQTIWQLVGKVATSLSTLIILALIARSYGERGTGLYTLVLTYLSMFYILADAGFNAHVLRVIQGEIDDSQQLKWRKLLGTRLALGLLLLLSSLLLLPLIPIRFEGFAEAVLLGSPAIIASSLYLTTTLIFQSKLKFSYTAYSLALGALIALVTTAWLIFTHQPAQLLVLGHLLSWVTISLASLLFIRGFITNSSPIFSKTYTLSLMAKTWPIALTLILNAVYFRLDSFLLAYFKNESVVGIYNMAYSVFQNLLVLPAFIINAFYPVMLEDLYSNIHLFNSNIRRAAVIFLGISIVLSFLVYTLASLIVLVITGGGFVGADNALRILALGLPAFMLTALFMWVIVAKGQYKTLLVIYSAGLLFNTMANLIFIPRYSFIAASWDTVVSEYLMLALQLVALRHLLKKNF